MDFGLGGIAVGLRVFNDPADVGTGDGRHMHLPVGRLLGG
jgi:hypothetical protein